MVNLSPRRREEAWEIVKAFKKASGRLVPYENRGKAPRKYCGLL